MPCPALGTRDRLGVFFGPNAIGILYGAWSLYILGVSVSSRWLSGPRQVTVLWALFLQLRLYYDTNYLQLTRTNTYS